MNKNRPGAFELIEDIKSRRVTYSKRKRGLIKKAIELSEMCGQHICITIFDKQRQKLVQYNSSFDFNPKVVSEILDPNILPQLTYTLYNNQDYQLLANSKKMEDVDDVGNDLIQNGPDKKQLDDLDKVKD